MKYFPWAVCLVLAALMTTGCGDEESGPRDNQHNEGPGQNEELDPDEGYDEDLIALRDACETQCTAQHECDLANGEDPQAAELDLSLCEYVCASRATGLQTTRGFAQLGGPDADALRRCIAANIDLWTCEVTLGCGEDGCVEEATATDVACDD